jgi:hypothetical protein
MGRSCVRALALSLLVVALVAVQGVTSVSAEEDDHPVGYTFGQGVRGVPAGCNFYEVDLATGAATKLNSAGVPCADGLTFDDDGTLYAYRNLASGAASPTSQLVKVNRHDGSQQLVAAIPGAILGAGGMTFDAEGDLWLYAVVFGDPQCGIGGLACLWEVDPDNGQSTFVGSAPLSRAVYGLAADCEDVLAISAIATGFSSGAALDEVNTKTAALERIVSLPGVGFPAGLDFEDDGDLWAIGTTTSFGSGIGPTLYRLDPTDGTSQAKDLTVNGVPLTGTVYGLAIEPVSCEDPGPEPAPPAPAPVVVAPVFTG